MINMYLKAVSSMSSSSSSSSISTVVFSSLSESSESVSLSTSSSSSSSCSLRAIRAYSSVSAIYYILPSIYNICDCYQIPLSHVLLYASYTVFPEIMCQKLYDRMRHILCDCMCAVRCITNAPYTL